MRLLIVNYHYIRDEQSNRGIYPVTRRGLELQVEEISRRYRFVGQADVVDLVANPDRARKDKDTDLCLLTFDDGLREQMDAFELLFRKGIQPLLCVPSSVLQKRVVLGVHKLHYLLQQLSAQEIYGYLQDEPVGCDADDAASRKQYRYDDELTRKVKYLINFVLIESRKM